MFSDKDMLSELTLPQAIADGEWGSRGMTIGKFESFMKSTSTYHRKPAISPTENHESQFSIGEIAGLYDT